MSAGALGREDARNCLQEHLPGNESGATNMNARLMKVTQAGKAVDCRRAMLECISILVQWRMVGGLSRRAKLEVIMMESMRHDQKVLLC